MKILVADDDPVSRHLMTLLLQRSGYEVVNAADGEEALERLASDDAPRLALLDWMMPRLDGLDVCRRIRARQGASYVHITLLTARYSEDDIVAGLEAGADDYLTKPCNLKELQARLRAGQRILHLEDTLVKAREELRFTATHDSLTGLWNHGAILSLLSGGLARAAHEHAPMAVLLCDADHFKRINDTHGHLAGDEVLRQLSSRLVNAVESFDEVGRYGGEEFLILLKGCTDADIPIRAERVRKAVAAADFQLDCSSLSVTISIGAVAVNNWHGDSPFEPLLKKADAALYLAKSRGRNRVVYSD